MRVSTVIFCTAAGRVGLAVCRISIVRALRLSQSVFGTILIANLLLAVRR